MSRRGQTSQKLSLISVVLLCPDGPPPRSSASYCWYETDHKRGEGTLFKSNFDRDVIHFIMHMRVC